VISTRRLVDETCRPRSSDARSTRPERLLTRATSRLFRFIDELNREGALSAGAVEQLTSVSARSSVSSLQRQKLRGGRSFPKYVYLKKPAVERYQYNTFESRFYLTFVNADVRVEIDGERGTVGRRSRESERERKRKKLYYNIIRHYTSNREEHILTYYTFGLTRRYGFILFYLQM